ncbi:MAG: hypothetical protein EWV80_06270 [Microcystis aeruginosa Ma_QC_B_20070730_S2]|uniref:Uncharacterized protein n=2 Tax=Microcystis aeruginosa TaxID=1126 RepID=A0A552E0D2_MICAE|nr:MAG: hypothetical protein EWV80_06270 [Microcystis aeruginosa Ma_QC_B_20070730_S2]
MTTDSIQVTAEEIAQFRAELADNPQALADLDMIDRCDGDLEYAAIRLVGRSNIDIVRAEGEGFWQQAITQARQLICHDHIRQDIAPNILGGLVGLLATSGNPVLVVVATPLAIHVFRETLDNFCD